MKRLALKKIVTPNASQIKVSYVSKIPVHARVTVTTSRDSHIVLRPMFTEETMEVKEEMVMLLLNRANKVIGWHHIGTGSLVGCVVNEMLICQIALLTNASGIIVAHNHPSGSLKPSSQDIKMCHSLTAALKLFGIKFFDSLILSPDGNYRSMADSIDF